MDTLTSVYSMKVSIFNELLINVNCITMMAKNVYLCSRGGGRHGRRNGNKNTPQHSSIAKTTNQGKSIGREAQMKLARLEIGEERNREKLEEE